MTKDYVVTEENTKEEVIIEVQKETAEEKNYLKTYADFLGGDKDE